ncbi:RNA polymerase sigma-I factor [Mycobacteroides abscessus]|uniref:RNA polymerase sigma-I factor n=1 Tax=Mycobacteroides abscessus TaxID=36809 RepID=UPI000C259A7B
MFLTRFLGKRSSQPSEAKIELEHDVYLAQNGDLDVRNKLIAQYTPFITQVASKVCKRFIDPSRDDEFSVAMEAFDEAVNKYTAGKGSSFLSFADLVIRRRIIDFIRKESRHRGQLSFEQTLEGEEESELSPVETQASIQQYQLDYEASLRKEEIDHYKEKLKEFDIDLMDLPEISPKHADARQNAIQVALTLVSSERLSTLFKDKKKLPMKELMNEVEVSRKTVERNRNYIVAIILLLMEDYHYLQSYLQLDEKGG